LGADLRGREQEFGQSGGEGLNLWTLDDLGDIFAMIMSISLLARKIAAGSHLFAARTLVNFTAANPSARHATPAATVR